MKNACKPAYPTLGRTPDFAQGSTKREEFAKAAMQGLLAGCGDFEMRPTYSDVAFEAVKHADALLKALEEV